MDNMGVLGRSPRAHHWVQPCKADVSATLHPPKGGSERGESQKEERRIKLHFVNV
jgi:hypothetical protein